MVHFSINTKTFLIYNNCYLETYPIIFYIDFSEIRIKCHISRCASQTLVYVSGDGFTRFHCSENTPLPMLLGTCSSPSPRALTPCLGPFGKPNEGHTEATGSQMKATQRSGKGGQRSHNAANGDQSD